MADHTQRNITNERLCQCCQREYESGWRCRGCKARFCDPCTKGGRSTATEKLLRLGAGVMTYGISEVARSAIRNKKQKCPDCDGVDLMRI